MFELEDLLAIASKRESVSNVNALHIDERIGSTPFIVQDVLHRGDYAFTYAAINSITDQKVVVKEFFPMSDFVFEETKMSLRREGQKIVLKDETPEKLRAFLTLKQQYKEQGVCLKKLTSEKHMVSIIEAFSENNSTYIVLEYLPYPTLSQLLKYKLLKPKEALKLFNNILSSVNA
jgi:serine/threonine protein kinase